MFKAVLNTFWSPDVLVKKITATQLDCDAKTTERTCDMVSRDDLEEQCATWLGVAVDKVSHVLNADRSLLLYYAASSTRANPVASTLAKRKVCGDVYVVRCYGDTGALASCYANELDSLLGLWRMAPKTITAIVTKEIEEQECVTLTIPPRVEDRVVDVPSLRFAKEESPLPPITTVEDAVAMVLAREEEKVEKKPRKKPKRTRGLPDIDTSNIIENKRRTRRRKTFDD